MATFTSSTADMPRSTMSGLTVTKICGASESKATAITPELMTALISLAKASTARSNRTPPNARRA